MDHPTLSTLIELQEHFDFEYLDHLKFASEITEARFSKHYAKARKRAEEFPIWQGSFYEKDIAAAKWPTICIQWIDEIIEYGVFATQNLPAKMYIGEYTGVISEKTFRFKPNLYCMAFLRNISGFRKFLINGEMAGNFTRFINHSSRPNLVLQTVYCEDSAHMIFTTHEPIEKGEQLTFDYGETYWRLCQKIPKVL